MKKIIAALSLMFAFTAFGQSGKEAKTIPLQAEKQRTMEDVLKMTDAEFRAETKKELSEIPEEMLPLVCMQVVMLQQMIGQACIANQAEMTEQEQKDCIRYAELLTISAEECQLKVESLNLGGAQ